MPRWAWAFVVLCGAIPVVAIGGLIPSVLGAAGATLCYAIAHDPQGKRSARQGILLCTAVTLVAWGAFGGLAWFILGRADEATPKTASASSSGRHRIVRENGKVVYDSRLPSREKRTLAEVAPEERRRIYDLATRAWDDLDEKHAELDARKADGGLTLRLEAEIEKLERKQDDHLEYVGDRFGLTVSDLDTLLDEGP